MDPFATSPPGVPGSTTTSLLDRARANDQEAWKRLVDLYGPLVYFWCQRSALRPEDLADVFQEVFRAVANGLARFRKQRPEDTFRGWLLIVTRNKIRDHFRRQQRQLPGAVGGNAAWQLLQIPDPLSDSELSDHAAAEKALLRRALEMLRPKFEETTWQAFWRAVVDGQDAAEIAPALGISVNAVYKSKGRVLQRIREELGDLLE